MTQKKAQTVSTNSTLAGTYIVEKTGLLAAVDGGGCCRDGSGTQRIAPSWHAPPNRLCVFIPTPPNTPPTLQHKQHQHNKNSQLGDDGPPVASQWSVGLQVLCSNQHEVLARWHSGWPDGVVHAGVAGVGHTQHTRLQRHLPIVQASRDGGIGSRGCGGGSRQKRRMTDEEGEGDSNKY